jgi:thioredoxin 1
MDEDPVLANLLRKRALSMKKNAETLVNLDLNRVNDVTDANIDEFIRTSPLPVLVDFSADAWCRPCQVMNPIIEELSHEFANQLLFLKLNTDHNPVASSKYRIFSVPTFMVFKDGNRVAQRVGASPKSKFKAWIEEVVERLQ